MKSLRVQLLVYTYISSLFFIIGDCLITDVTSTVLGNHRYGLIAAYGDFDADKHTDIFVITDAGKTLKLLLAALDKEFSEITLLGRNSSNGTITSVVPADFDGDSQMDILVTRKLPDKTYTTVEIYWGTLDKIGLEEKPLILPDEFADQPLLLDANGDMIPDLMGQIKGSKIINFWIFKRGLREEPVITALTTEEVELKVPQSSGFVDLSNDLTADLCLVTVDSVIVWRNTNGVFKKHSTVKLPTGTSVIGQATFIDVDGNGKMDIIFPTCHEASCKHSEIHVLYNEGSEFVKLPVDFEHGGKLWRYVLPEENPQKTGTTIPITLRPGDYNFDGFPDLLSVLKDDKGNQRAIFLNNVGCSGNCDGHGRTFEGDWSTQLHSTSEKAVLPSFYDYVENGIMDVMISTYTETTKKFNIHLLKHEFVEDACFIKVMVTSGLCHGNCPGGRKPYGVNQPGPAATFQTLDSDGKTQVGSATQLTQSAYFSLHLPFIMFGLGQTPNFLDTLVVGISHPNGTGKRTRSWASVIPNSQLIIIPYPNEEPSSWTNRLFVTPSRLVLDTGAALLGTCGFLAVIVGILQWREKVEDKKEKLQEAHKFHFDAM